MFTPNNLIICFVDMMLANNKFGIIPYRFDAFKIVVL